MGDVYRIGTKVPWEDDFRDWSRRFSTVDGVVDEFQARARGHRGAEFRERYRGQSWGKDRDLPGTLDATTHDLTHGQFGDVVIIEANRDRVEWRIRKIRDVEDTIDRPEANDHVDFLYTYVFKTHHDEYPSMECWGTCNRRYIDGTATWSQHAPWLPGAGNAGCNAIDFHGSYDAMYKLSRDLAGKDHVAKILFYAHEWTPETGWIPVNIGHYDHVHVEGPRNHGSLASTCQY